VDRAQYIDTTQHGSGNMSYTFEGVETGGTQLALIETAILQGKEWWKYMVQTVDTCSSYVSLDSPVLT